MELITTINVDFIYNNEAVRIVGTFENPHFVLKDICKILGLTNTTAVLKNIPKKWYKLVSIKNGVYGLQDTYVITEPGLYRIIMRSNKPVAQPFQDWICEEVLPTIRKTGRFKMSDEYIEKIEKLQAEIAENHKTIQATTKELGHRDFEIRQLQHTVEDLEEMSEEFQQFKKEKENAERMRLLSQKNSYLLW